MIFMPGQTPPESCQPPPDPPSHSPRMARAATSRRSRLLEPAGERAIWPVARMQTEIRQASRLVETASREPLGMSLTRLTSSMPRPGPASCASSSASGCCAPSMPGGTMPEAITRGLQQAEIVAREIEHFGQGGDVRGGAQIDAGQPQHRLVDHAEVRLDRRPRVAGSSAAAHRQIDRDVQHARAFGDNPCPGRRCRSSRCASGPCAPAWSRAGWDRGGRHSRIEQFRTDRQRIIVGVPDAEHPLIAAHRAHAAPHLVGEGLEREPVIGRGQGAR